MILALEFPRRRLTQCATFVSATAGRQGANRGRRVGATQAAKAQFRNQTIGAQPVVR